MIEKTRIRPCLLVYDPVGDFAELSNFFPSEFTSEGVVWRSVEHFYQAAKFASLFDRESIRACPTAADARNLAWGDLHAKVNPDWDNMRVAVMQTALRLKYQACAPARCKLLSTWPYPIAEDSLTDSFWGLGSDGLGHNTLGVLLEALRSDLLGLPPLSIRFNGLSLSDRSPESRISAIACMRFEIPDSHTKLDQLMLVSGNLTSISIDDLINTQLLNESDMPDFRQPPIESKQVQSVHSSTQAWRSRALPWALSQLAALAPNTFRQLRGHAFDMKYANYRWAEDARSAVPNWSNRFLNWFGCNLTVPAAQTRGVIVGAGAGEETAMVWSRFPGRLLLVDVGQELAENCRRQHPGAEVCCRSAEDLQGIEDVSFDFYCSLRTYQSVHFDSKVAITEARRVLRPKGLIVLSVSDAYLRADGSLQRGEIVDDRIDLSASLTLLCTLSDLLTSSGFVSIGFHSFETELVVFGRLGA